MLESYLTITELQRRFGHERAWWLRRIHSGLFRTVKLSTSRNGAHHVLLADVLDVVDTAEAARLLGTSIFSGALADRRRSTGFPEPIAELACGPIWHMDDIDNYLEERERDPFAAYRWSNQPGRWERHLERKPSRRR